MQTKLTLRIDEELIEVGKILAKQQGKSLSRLIADYLATLEELSQQSDELPLSPGDCLGLLAALMRRTTIVTLRKSTCEGALRHERAPGSAAGTITFCGSCGTPGRQSGAG
jgi:hypothetical protein